MQFVSLEATPPQPWRNGGGTTRELLAWPSAEAWALRLSIARIDRDGPFSAYPGIDRWFAVLQGAGVELGWENHVAQVKRGSAPLHFGGADAPQCRLLDGPTEDLNLMLRSDAGRGGLEAAIAGRAWPCSACWRGLYTSTACTLRTASSEHHLPAGTLAWTEHADAAPWIITSPEPLHAWWLHFEASTP
jgi:environmental stress-induced protein Ves